MTGAGLRDRLSTWRPADTREPSGTVRGIVSGMERMAVSDEAHAMLAYEVRGDGDPVVFVHAGGLADWFLPLLDEPALAAGHRLVSYHRAGYGGSGRAAAPADVPGLAAHCLGLLRGLGIARAHLVGHSSGGSIALQVALDAPDAVLSLALLEPVLPAVPMGPYVAEAVERYQSGDRPGALDHFLRGVGGPDYRRAIERRLPGALEQAAVADIDTFFGRELPALRGWTFTAAEARRVTQPVLLVLGADSSTVSPVFWRRHELLQAWLPCVRSFVLPGATHLLHVQNPAAMATALAAFIARHPAA